MALTDTQVDDYAKYARNPDTWVLAARRSLAVARLLRLRANELARFSEREFFEFSGCHYAAYFHAAMAVENALKAVLISRDPSIVDNGVLNLKKFGGKSAHALLDLGLTVLTSLSDEEQRLLTKLEEYVWAGRYTVPTRGDVLYDHDRMNNMRTSTAAEPDMLTSLIDRIVNMVGK